jgi:hypothetical protein
LRELSLIFDPIRRDEIDGADIFARMDAHSVILSRPTEGEGVSKNLAPPIFWRRDLSGSSCVVAGRHFHKRERVRLLPPDRASRLI